MDESENYTLAVEENTERGSLRVLLAYPRECLTVVGLTLGGTIAFYTFTTYMSPTGSAAAASGSNCSCGSSSPMSLSSDRGGSSSRRLRPK